MKKKRKLLIIARVFHPESDGTIACVEKIIPYLSEYFDITLMCAKTKNSPDFEEKSEVKIRRYSTIWDRCVIYKDFLVEKIRTNYREKNRILALAMQVCIQALFYPFKMVARYRGVIFPNGFKHHFYNLVQQEAKDFEYVLCTVEPVENASIILQLIHDYPYLKWILLQFDMYACAKGVTPELFSQRILEVEEWYQKAYLVVVQREMMKKINHGLLSKHSDKILPLFIPSMPCIYQDDNEKNSSKKYIYRMQAFKQIVANEKIVDFNVIDEKSILVVYSGLFYENIRNPKFMLSCMQRVCSMNSHLVVCLIGGGCESIVSEYKDSMGSQLLLCGRQPREITDGILKNADILINIGNTIKEMVPSKIMEYIGLRKPIVNFFSIKEDSCEAYLKNYPLHYSVFQEEKYADNKNESVALNSELHNEAMKLSRFIDTHFGQLCNYQYMIDNYGKYSAEEFVNTLINKIHGV